MSYDKAIDYLYGLQKHGIKLGLANISTIAEVLGQPQRAFYCVHVAGTNGKGSTSAMIASIIRANGLKTGLFTSPHLVRFTERIRVDGVEITEEEVVSLTREIREALRSEQGLRVTFFEFVTAMAFLHFKSQGVQWVVLETGMGGRYDATNIITPQLTIITSISEDHKEFLGNSIADIAAEKAGIIKPAVEVITACRDEIALEVLKAAAREKVSDIDVYGTDFDVSSVRAGVDGTTLDYHGHGTYRRMEVPLVGAHQAENAACAIRAWEVLSRKGHLAGDEGILRRALKGVAWPGRCEMTSFDGVPVLLDGAHNPDAMRQLAATLRDVFLNPKDQKPPFLRIILIIGTMSDKDKDNIIVPILPVAHTVIFTSANYPRAERAERLLAIAQAMLPEMNGAFHSTDSVRDALALARTLYQAGDLVVVTGSFYTVGDAREVIGGEVVSLKSLTESTGKQK
ncbi:MAG: bifunctional folylpolyglutamate synthase/dihydrofolate synthase [Nitrospirae bacterium]|uniref:bifunctional folylpolyglutamate synthase/dihydrofolate synthase n=1 Tax=Candidatus Magnetobacterium casense TaxID=1455061 RepID=UPI000697B71C|nr:folylpolyglutamate synthase/dihydrofolate synthase family protein [Candidatus Magnetobacterium casensis]MBF0336521.1 bifunctional folylpolyglutamate synthase/dihydrofolate synthase [Nitrospirota bacterium]